MKFSRLSGLALLAIAVSAETSAPPDALFAAIRAGGFARGRARARERCQPGRRGRRRGAGGDGRDLVRRRAPPRRDAGAPCRSECQRSRRHDCLDVGRHRRRESQDPARTRRGGERQIRHRTHGAARRGGVPGHGRRPAAAAGAWRRPSRKGSIRRDGLITRGTIGGYRGRPVPRRPRTRSGRARVRRTARGSRTHGHADDRIPDVEGASAGQGSAGHRGDVAAGPARRSLDRTGRGRQRGSSRRPVSADGAHERRVIGS